MHSGEIENTFGSFSFVKRTLWTAFKNFQIQKSVQSLFSSKLKSGCINVNDSAQGILLMINIRRPENNIYDRFYVMGYMI